MKVSDFSRFILPEVIGCPDPVLEQAVVQTAYEFCDKTGAWDEVQDPQALVAGTGDYDIDVPPGAILMRVRNVWIDGQAVASETFERVAVMSRDLGSPVYFNAAIDRAQIRLFPTPSADGGQMVVRAVYAPAMTATSLPDFLLQRHTDAISSGAKARLMLMPNMVWSNAQLGSYHSDRFTSGIVSARIESLHDRVEGSPRVSPRSFNA